MRDEILADIFKAMEAQKEAQAKQAEELKDLKKLVDDSQILGFQKLAAGLSAELGRCQKEAVRLRATLSAPVTLSRLPRGIWGLVVLVALVGLLSAGWWNARADAVMYRDADTRLRYLRLALEPAVRAAVRKADSLEVASLRDSVLKVEAARLRYYESVAEAAELKRIGFGR